MDPFTIGMALVSVAGGALDIYGKISAGDAKARQMYDEGLLSLDMAKLYGINAETAASNVELLTTQAEIAGEGTKLAYAKAALTKGRISETGRVTLAAQRAEFASRNIDPTFGSPLLASGLTAGRIAADMDLTDAQGAIEAADALSKRANIINAAANERGKAVTAIGQQLTATKRALSLFRGGEDAESAAGLGALSSLLSVGGSLAGKFGGGGGGGGELPNWGTPAFVGPT